MRHPILKLLIVFLLFSAYANACQCPMTELSEKSIAPYDLIFKGKIISITLNKGKGEAMFLIQELYRGNSYQEFKILFNDEDPCKQELREGDEWIIYTNYYQIDNAKLDFCSRSRKFFKQDKEDFVNSTTGVSYNDEMVFLQTKLGLHKLLKENPHIVESRNIIPTDNQKIITLVCSILFIILFYWLFNKFVK